MAVASPASLLPMRGRDAQAQARAAQSPPVTVRDAWVREAAAGRAVTAAFLVLENTGDALRALVRGAATVGDTLEFHEMKRDAGMMCMSPAPPLGPAGGDFTLIDQDGARFELASLREKVVLVFFGYSQCPDVCPTTLSKLSSVAQRLGDQSGERKVVYVTVDPERDTPGVLKADLGNFALDAVGLTGTREEIDRVVAQYGAKYEIVPTPESAARYTVSHSTTRYVLDRTGKLRLQFPYEATVGEIAEAVRKLRAA